MTLFRKMVVIPHRPGSAGVPENYPSARARLTAGDIERAPAPRRNRSAFGTADSFGLPRGVMRGRRRYTLPHSVRPDARSRVRLTDQQAASR
jgi:hypothetical protein